MQGFYPADINPDIALDSVTIAESLFGMVTNKGSLDHVKNNPKHHVRQHRGRGFFLLINPLFSIGSLNHDRGTESNLKRHCQGPRAIGPGYRGLAHDDSESLW